MNGGRVNGAAVAGNGSGRVVVCAAIMRDITRFLLASGLRGLKAGPGPELVRLIQMSVTVSALALDA